jgi:hypothetical protein
MAKAGLMPGARRFAKEDYFENLLKVWTHHARQPKLSDMDMPPSEISSGAYERRFGRWTSALKEFVEAVSSDAYERQVSTSAPSPSPKTTNHVVSRQSRSGAIDQRSVGLSLRYQVLKRDRFRCVLCGVSPATTPGCLLHVDHVVPWSKDGRSSLENLRTLCDSCNLGKGAQVE